MQILTLLDGVLYLLIALPVLALVIGAAMPGILSPTIAVLRTLRGVLNTGLASLGRSTAWLSLLMVLVMFVVVLLRYIFGIGFIWMQESVTYMHGLLFMLASAYTLAIDGHVRVDIFYRDAPEKIKALTNLLGTYILLFPIMFLIVDLALPYVEVAWDVKEGSKETSGIQAVYLFKTAILAFAWTMILQGVSLAASAVLYLIGAEERHNPSETTDVEGSVHG